MSAPHSYEISFRAVLDDRQVDELADTLFELGYDGACFRPLPEPKPYLVSDRDALRAADQHDIQRTLK